MQEEISYSNDRICFTLKRDKNRAWFSANGVYAKGYLFAPDGSLYQDKELLNYFSDVESENLFAKKIKEANGCFAILINHKNMVWAAVDRVRSFPVFYTCVDGKVYITDDINNLAGMTFFVIDKERKEEFAFLGYTTGKSTLLKSIYQIQAGEYIVVDSKSIHTVIYHSLIGEIDKNREYDVWKSELKEIIFNVGKRLVYLLNGRPAAIPLSGGYDSRLIAYLLYKEKYESVLCFTYGKPVDNVELKHSKDVAHRLGFEWLFIDYMKHGDNRYIYDPQFLSYCSYITQFSSCYFYQEYPAIQYLIKEKKISSDTIFLPGHGGDFIAGSHLRPFMRNYSGKKQIATDLFTTHFQGKDATLGERKKIVLSLISQLNGFSSQSASFQEIENLDQKERQAKYIVNSSKIWEYFGFSYCLPLLDTELMDYFSSMPFEYKLGKKLYDEVLQELFAEEGIAFEDDFCLAKAFHPYLDTFRNRIKRHIPFVKGKRNLWKFDSVGFQYMMEALMQELHEKKLDKDLRSFNGATFTWYLLQLEKEYSVK